MSKRPEHEMEALEEEWKKRMYREEFSEMSKGAQAKDLGVGIGTIYKWHEGQTKAWWDNRASSMRSMYAQHMPEIDSAVLKKAKTGDINAAELAYKRFEGWSPKQTNENINRNGDLEGKTDEEILLEMLRKAPKELVDKVQAERGAPGVVVEAEKSGNG